MTSTQALAGVAAGVVLAVAGLTWAVGPWALFGSGLLIAAVALLVPVKERRGEPFDELDGPVPPPQ